MKKEALNTWDVVVEWDACEGDIEVFKENLLEDYDLTETEKAVILAAYYFAEHAKWSK